MAETKATGSIRVIKTPAGEAPEQIRAAWVGLVLPCEPISGKLPWGEELHIPSFKPTNRSRDVVIVPIKDALEIIAQERPFAAEWYAELNIPFERADHFAFGLDEVEILSGVEQQKIVEVTDEMQGDPNR